MACFVDQGVVDLDLVGLESVSPKLWEIHVMIGMNPTASMFLLFPTPADHPWNHMRMDDGFASGHEIHEALLCLGGEVLQATKCLFIRYLLDTQGGILLDVPDVCPHTAIG